MMTIRKAGSWREYIPDGKYFRAYDKGLVGGFALAYQFGRHVLYCVRIMETRRGKGYGQAMIAWLVRYATRNKIPCIRLFVNVRNECAQHVYRKSGFIVVGENDTEYVMEWRQA